MGSCASVVRRKNMQSNALNKSNSPNTPNTAYAPYTAKNNSNYHTKQGITIKKMSDYNTNPTYNGTPRYT